MSATTPLSEDEEHDLVLMFANARIPRGSDAFQAIISDLLPACDSSSADEKESLDSVDGHTDKSVNRLEPDSKSKEKKSVRMVSPRPLTRVHWPDESHDKLSSSPTPDKRHSARIYMKTNPKPILKHEDHAIIVDTIPQGQG